MDVSIKIERPTDNGPLVITFGPDVWRNANVRLEMTQADADRLQSALYEVLWDTTERQVIK